MSYGGTVVSVRRDLVAALVIPAWPQVGKARVAPIARFVDEVLQDELPSHDSILLPESEWPKINPRSRVHADDTE